MFPRGPRRRYRAERFGIGALTRPTAPCEGAPPRRWHSRLGARGRPVVDAVAREARRDRRTPEVPTRPPEADGAARAVTRPVFARAPRPRAWTAGGSRAGHREEVCNSEAHHGDEESRGSLPLVSRDISSVVWPHIFPRTRLQPPQVATMARPALVAPRVDGVPLPSLPRYHPYRGTVGTILTAVPTVPRKVAGPCVVGGHHTHISLVT